MVGMADHHDRAEADVTDPTHNDPTHNDHGDVRRRFVELWNVRTSGDAGELALDAAWQPIANLLDGHASDDPSAADPNAIEQDSDQAPKESNHESGGRN